VVILFLILFERWCGMIAVGQYATRVFASADTGLSSLMSSLLIQVVICISNIVSTFFVDRSGRRMLLMVSSAVMCLSLIAFATYFKLIDDGSASSSSLGWLPLTSLLICYAGFEMGFGPVPWISMAEMLPTETRGPAGGVVVVWNAVNSFLVTQFFNSMVAALNDYGVYYMYSAASALAFIFVLFFFPETKGKTLAEIQEYYKSSKIVYLFR